MLKQQGMETGIKCYSFKKGGRYEIEILPLQMLYTEHADISSKPHRVSFYNVFWFQEAPQEHIVDLKRLKELRNMLVFVGKDQIRTFQKNPQVTGKILMFTDQFFCRSETDLAFLKNSPLFHSEEDVAAIRITEAGDELLEHLRLMEQELGGEDDCYKYDILQNLLHNFLLLCERRYGRATKGAVLKSIDQDYATLFRDLLNGRFRSLKSVAGYAACMNVSEKKLTQAVAKATGKTPKELIDERVMLEVKRLLLHTCRTVKEIGYELGFEEPTNFIKFFRKHAGETPLQYRGRHRLSDPKSII